MGMSTVRLSLLAFLLFHFPCSFNLFQFAACFFSTASFRPLFIALPHLSRTSSLILLPLGCLWCCCYRHQSHSSSHLSLHLLALITCLLDLIRFGMAVPGSGSQSWTPHTPRRPTMIFIGPFLSIFTNRWCNQFHHARRLFDFSY